MLLIERDRQDNAECCKLTIQTIAFQAVSNGLVSKRMLSRFIPDRFVLLLLGAVLFGWLLPVSGQGLMIAQNVSFVSIFALFFLHGLRLPRQEVVKAARSWKVQGAMLVFSFVAMPLAGLALVKGAGWMLPAALALSQPGLLAARQAAAPLVRSPPPGAPYKQGTTWNSAWKFSSSVIARRHSGARDVNRTDANAWNIQGGHCGEAA